MDYLLFLEQDIIGQAVAQVVILEVEGDQDQVVLHMLGIQEQIIMDMMVLEAVVGVVDTTPVTLMVLVAVELEFLVKEQTELAEQMHQLAVVVDLVV